MHMSGTFATRVLSIGTTVDVGQGSTNYHRCRWSRARQLYAQQQTKLGICSNWCQRTAASMCSNVREQKWVYSITSSARPISIVGCSRPSTLAVMNEKDSPNWGCPELQMRKIGQLSRHLLSFEDGNAMNRLAVGASAIGSHSKGLTVS